MGDVVNLHARPVAVRPRGCDPTPLRRDNESAARADLLMLLSAARAVLDARNRTQRTLAIARLGAAVASIDRGGISA